MSTVGNEAHQFQDLGAPTFTQVAELLSYEPATGALRWRVDRAATVKAGDQAGHLHGSGYWRVSITIGGRFRTFLAHRVAWLLYYGKWPDQCIDHIDGCTWNNRISNLRDVSVTQNQQNQKKPHIGNQTGYLGVSQIGANRWQARIRVEGKERSVGVFRSPHEAGIAYVMAKRKLHPAGTI